MQLITKTIQQFYNDEMPFMGTEFTVFSYSREELLAIYIGIFVKEGFIRNDEALRKLLQFTIDISNGYLNNAYHSFHHAVDVSYTAYYILRNLGVIQQAYLSRSRIVALLLAALGHDVLHPGLNNQYQVIIRR
jgi:hypothetical protein